MSGWLLKHLASASASFRAWAEDFRRRHRIIMFFINSVSWLLFSVFGVLSGIFQMLFGNILVLLFIVVIGGTLLAGTIFEDMIRMYDPTFSGPLLISSVVLIGGLVYAIIERNIIIGIFAVIVSMTVPLVHEYIRMYGSNIVQALLGG